MSKAIAGSRRVKARSAAAAAAAPRTAPGIARINLLLRGRPAVPLEGVPVHLRGVLGVADREGQLIAAQTPVGDGFALERAGHHLEFLFQLNVPLRRRPRALYFG